MYLRGGGRATLGADSFGGVQDKPLGGLRDKVDGRSGSGYDGGSGGEDRRQSRHVFFDETVVGVGLLAGGGGGLSGGGVGV